MIKPEILAEEFKFAPSAGDLNELYESVAANIEAEHALRFEGLDDQLDSLLHAMPAVLYRLVDRETYSNVLVYIREVQIGKDTLISVVSNTTSIDISDFSERNEIDQYLIDRTYRGVSYVQTRAVVDRDAAGGWRPLATKDELSGIGPRLTIMYSEDDSSQRLEVTPPKPPYAIPEVGYYDLSPIYERTLTRRIRNLLNLTDPQIEVRMGDVMLVKESIDNMTRLSRLLSCLEAVPFEEDIRLPHQ